MVCDAVWFCTQRHSTAAAAAAAVLQGGDEKAHPLLLLLSLRIVALSPLELAEHQIVGCVVCIVCGASRVWRVGAKRIPCAVGL